MIRMVQVIVLALPLLLAAACQASATPVPTRAPTATTAPANTVAPTPTVAAMLEGSPTAAPTSGGMALPSLAIALNQQNESGQSGVAILTARGQQTEIVLNATAGISQANHIHNGSCAELGNVAYPLTNMAEGSSITTVNAPLASLLTGGFAINLHKAGSPSVYTACGDLPANGQFIVVALDEQNASGQMGMATLTERGEKTEVVLNATAGISQANHIHNGSCAELGNVAYPLTNMADGLSVTLVNAALESLQTGAYAINLHKAGAPSVYTACGNIPAKG